MVENYIQISVITVANKLKKYSMSKIMLFLFSYAKSIISISSKSYGKNEGDKQPRISFWNNENTNR